MLLSFSAPVWEWRGPAPYYFVTVPEPESGMTVVRRAEGIGVGDLVALRLTVDV